jgi:hypothetical protein
VRSHHLPFRPLWIMLVLAAALPADAVAQEGGPVEIAGGYSYMRDYDGDATFPRGWFASIGADVAGPVGVVGDVSGSYKSMGGLDVDLSVSVHTVTGGPRLIWRSDRVAPYVQVLFGLARIATTFELPDETLSASQNNFVMVPGGGLDIRVSERSALRVGANLRLIRSETTTPAGTEPFTFKEFQFLAGIVVR